MRGNAREAAEEESALNLSAKPAAESSRIRAIAFSAIVVALLGLGVALNALGVIDAPAAAQALQALASENLPLAFGAYFAFTVVGSTLLALPGALFAIAAGVVFGPVVGTLACTVSCGVGAVFSFLAARYFLGDAVRSRVEGNPRLSRWLFGESQTSSVVLLAVTRLVPIFPFNLQNFAYGVTGIRLGTYTVCTLVFMLPGCALYTVGAAGVIDPDVRVACFAVAAALLALSLAVGFFLKRRYVK